jgi:hypothetical protein
LVLFAVVPVVVKVGEAGGDLLEGAAAVGIDGCDGWVVDSSKIYPTKVLDDGLENREGGTYHNLANTIYHTAPTANSETPHQSDPAPHRAQSH